MCSVRVMVCYIVVEVSLDAFLCLHCYHVHEDSESWNCAHSRLYADPSTCITG
jgi:hypothetical protein